jgi:hypothetical protein
MRNCKGSGDGDGRCFIDTDLANVPDSTAKCGCSSPILPISGRERFLSNVGLNRMIPMASCS